MPPVFCPLFIVELPGWFAREARRQFVTNEGGGQRLAETMLVISAAWNNDPQAKTMGFIGSLY
jgi:hypothetical protein